MRLRTINRWLRRVGLVLVVSTDDDPSGHTRIWVERAKSYDARCMATAKLIGATDT